MRLALAALAASLAAAVAHAQPRADLHLVIVLDGLRPDSITERETPNLHRLRREGVDFANSHAVFPTVTRVNASSIGTGAYPDRHGIMGNTIYIPSVDRDKAFNNDNAALLMKIEGPILTAPGLASILQGAGKRFAVVSSGSTGSALLLAPESPKGVGLVVNSYIKAGEIAAWPESASAKVLERFGRPPVKGGATANYDPQVAHTIAVLGDYVLPEVKPHVAITWLAEPDHIQHAHGPGSPEAMASIRHDDEQVGRLLAKLEALGLRSRTNVIVLSDHGFAQTTARVNVGQELKDAGLAGEDVVLASSGQAMALHVKGRDPARVAAIAGWLVKQRWCGVVFTAAASAGAVEGRVPGTFALEYANLGGHERSPDIVFTFPWSSARNTHGMQGTETNIVASGATGPANVATANHGGIGPWTVRNTMIAWGPDFKRGVTVRTPAGNVDVAPTILHLLGLEGPARAMQGRVLREALVEGPDEEQVPMTVTTREVASGDYRAVLQASEVDGKRYVDKAWRR